MFEIKNEDMLFRLSFIERIIVPEERQEDAIMCWLEIKDKYINLQCECELIPFDLQNLKSMTATFYEALFSSRPPKMVEFSPRMPFFTCGFVTSLDCDPVNFFFTASPHVYDSWELKGEIMIDQSYFPGLIQGIESILTN